MQKCDEECFFLHLSDFFLSTLFLCSGMSLPFDDKDSYHHMALCFQKISSKVSKDDSDSLGLGHEPILKSILVDKRCEEFLLLDLRVSCRRVLEF